MNRKDFKQSLICLVKEGAYVKPDLYKAEVGGKTLMIKDVREKNFFFRWTLGLWLIHKEWKIYSRLAGIKGIPQPVERIDCFAFAMEFIPGRPIRAGENLSLFLLHLEQVLGEVHGRGVVHLDLRHKGNILLSEKREPFLIDFNSSLTLKKRGFFGVIFFLSSHGWITGDC